MFQLLKEAELKSTCLSRNVGCVILSKDGVVLSVGYNHHYDGVSCIESGLCLRAGSDSGKNLDKCKIVHAEIDALNKCVDIDVAHTLFVSASPCVNCTEKLLETNIKRIVYVNEYPHTESKRLWINCGRIWEPFNNKMETEMDEIKTVDADVSGTVMEPCFNDLRKNLNHLQEESAKVVQAATKIQRYGLKNKRKNHHEDNQKRLGKEVGNLLCMVDLMLLDGSIKQKDIDEGKSEKIASLKNWY